MYIQTYICIYIYIYIYIYMFTCAFHPQTVAFPSPLPPPPTPLAPPPPRAVLEGRLGSVSVFENILSPIPLLEPFSSKPWKQYITLSPLARALLEQGWCGVGLCRFWESLCDPSPPYLWRILRRLGFVAFYGHKPQLHNTCFVLHSGLHEEGP